jgi:hypothetical protein
MSLLKKQFAVDDNYSQSYSQSGTGFFTGGFCQESEKSGLDKNRGMATDRGEEVRISNVNNL